VCSLEEECFVGRHLFMSMVFGLFQVIMYVLCLPLLSVFFMWRNHRNLDKHVVRTRYGLFLGGYRDDRYFWEIVLVARKFIVIFMSVFGQLIPVATQTHVVLLFVLLFMLAEAVGQPFDSTSGGNDHYGTPKIRYRTLHRLEMSSLFVIWLTLWCGLLIYQIDDIDSALHTLVTLFVFAINVLLMVWMIWKFVIENVYEFKHNKYPKDEKKSNVMKCLTNCTERTLQACPCLNEDPLLKRFSTANPFYGKEEKNDDVGTEEGEVELVEMTEAKPNIEEEQANQWTRLVDPDTGAEYLYNQETNESKWATAEEDLPPSHSHSNAMLNPIVHVAAAVK
jgi:hypothetical protein